MFLARQYLPIALIGLVAVALTSCEALAPITQPEEEDPGETPPNSVSLSWQAPTLNADGTPLGDLASFNIYYGSVSPLSDATATVVNVGNVTTYTVRDLQPGVYYFAVSAVDQNGNASSLSDEVRTEISAQ